MLESTSRDMPPRGDHGGDARRAGGGESGDGTEWENGRPDVNDRTVTADYTVMGASPGPAENLFLRSKAPRTVSR